MQALKADSNPSKCLTQGRHRGFQRLSEHCLLSCPLAESKVCSRETGMQEHIKGMTWYVVHAASQTGMITFRNPTVSPNSGTVGGHAASL